MLATKTKAPDFTLPDQDGISRSLSDFKGGYVLVYFYPKDDTPGCTKEACMIGDVFDDFQKAGITVLGISSDSPASHTKFRLKYHLPFTLLSDKEKKVIALYGAKNDVGGTKRISYLIKNGVIVQSYPKVTPATHALEILKDVSSL